MEQLVLMVISGIGWLRRWYVSQITYHVEGGDIVFSRPLPHNAAIGVVRSTIDRFPFVVVDGEPLTYVD